MATVQSRINTWRQWELRGASQVNENVALIWYNKGLKIFQKNLLEYVANQLQIQTVTQNITAGTELYSLPTAVSVGSWVTADFYSIAQLRVAYKKDKNGYPVYRVCEPINIADYNIHPKTGKSVWQPFIWSRISKFHPRYMFTGKNEIRIFPKPDQNVTAWLNLTFNYISKDVSLNTNEESLGLPTYFLDAVEDYLSYRLIQAENPELAMTYYQRFIDTLHDNIYGLNRDQRPVEEEFADLRWLYIN